MAGQGLKNFDGSAQRPSLFNSNVQRCCRTATPWARVERDRHTEPSSLVRTTAYLPLLACVIGTVNVGIPTTNAIQRCLTARRAFQQQRG